MILVPKDPDNIDYAANLRAAASRHKGTRAAELLRACADLLDEEDEKKGER